MMSVVTGSQVRRRSAPSVFTMRFLTARGGEIPRIIFGVATASAEKPLVRPEGGEEVGEHHSGVWGPVSVVAAVEVAVGAVDGDVEAGDTADAEDELGLAGLMLGAVADDPDAGVVESVAIGFEILFEVW